MPSLILRCPQCGAPTSKIRTIQGGALRVCDRCGLRDEAKRFEMKVADTIKQFNYNA